MDEYKTEKAVYTLSDFLLWEENEMLLITPKFQRRPVWRTPARSYFIDTLLRGMTVPPLYLRKVQQDGKVVREVVDGQQRIRSAMEFAKDGYRLSTTLKNAPWKGKKFSGLSPEEQEAIMSFSFTAEIFKGISDKEVLEVFCRLNMNGVPLNNQELRNGRFFGLFKQSAFELALNYLQFWRNNKIFSEQNIARMLEVELTSELLIAGHVGMQDKKKSIDKFYGDWEDIYPDQSKDERRLKETFAAISETITPEELAASEFHRPPFFYTLYCVVYHYMFGLPTVQRVSPRKRMSSDQKESLKDSIEMLSELIMNSKDPAFIVPKKYAKFIGAGIKQTDNIMPRKIRFDTLYDQAF